MCRFGCSELNSTFMCKWCGTRYCRECLHGDFHGEMKEPGRCKKCNQAKCQGQKVEFVIARPDAECKEDGKKGKSSARSRSKSPGKSGKKSASKKKSGGKKKGKKGGKKKKKK